MRLGRQPRATAKRASRRITEWLFTFHLTLVNGRL
jgi:hypothetical protein